jgi:hypothetical protein
MRQAGRPDGYKKFYLVFKDVIKGQETLDFVGMNVLPKVLTPNDSYVCIFEWPNVIVYDFTDYNLAEVQKIIEQVSLLITPNTKQ